MNKPRIEPINGAYFDKNGRLKNLDGTYGPKANYYGNQRAPFNGAFVGSDGKVHDISEILAGLGNGSNISMDDVNDAINDALNQLPDSPTQAQIDQAIQDALSNFPAGASMTQVNDAINEAIAALDKGPTIDAINQAIADAIAALPEGATIEDVHNAIQNAIDGIDTGSLSAEEVKALINAAIDALPKSVDINTVNQAIQDAIDALPEGVTMSEIQQAISSAIDNIDTGALDAAEIKDLINAALANLPSGITMDEVEDAIENAMNSITPAPTQEDIDQAIQDALDTIPKAPTMAEINKAIQDAIAGISTSTNLDDIPTILMGDNTKFAIAEILIVNQGFGWTMGEVFTINPADGVMIDLTVKTVDPQGRILSVTWEPETFPVDFSTGNLSVEPITGPANGYTPPSFAIRTMYGVGTEVLRGYLSLVPYHDPLVQLSMLIGYVRDVLKLRFPIGTDDISDGAITSNKISDTAIFAGDGIDITKDENGIVISTGAAGLTVSFVNLDQDGNVIS